MKRLEVGLSKPLNIPWDRVAALLSLLLLVAGLGGGIYLLNRPEKEPEPPVPLPKQLDREVMRGAKMFSPHQGTQPIVQFDSIRIVKPRFGGISLGGFNRLEIDGLKLFLYPDVDENAGASDSEGGFSNVRKLLNVEELCRRAGIYQRVSSLRINSLCVFVFENEKTAQILCAKSAKSVTSGRILLKGCDFLDEALVLQRVSEAELDVERGVLTGGEFAVRLETVVENIKGAGRE